MEVANESDGRHTRILSLFAMLVFELLPLLVKGFLEEKFKKALGP